MSRVCGCWGLNHRRPTTRERVAVAVIGLAVYTVYTVIRMDTSDNTYVLQSGFPAERLAESSEVYEASPAIDRSKVFPGCTFDARSTTAPLSCESGPPDAVPWHRTRRANTYVLQSGFPAERLADSSEVYEASPAVDKSKVFPGFPPDAVPWHRTQRWIPKSADKLSLGGEGGGGGGVRYPHCRQLLYDDGSEREKKEDVLMEAKRFMADNEREAIDDLQYIRRTEHDCPTFVRERGYILEASPKEKAFPLAFSILLYKDFEQAERLLRAVYRPHNVYCLHVDSKSPTSILNAAKGLASCLKNVFLASRQVRVTWGQFTVLEPELICMQDLLRHKKWRYFINLTGQEFPLKTNLQLVDILTALNGSNDVDCTTSRDSYLKWQKNSHAPYGIQPRMGSVHMTASRGFVDFLLHDRQVNDFLAWVKFTGVPDETFFATLNHNPLLLKAPGAYLGDCDTDALRKPHLSRYKNWGHRWRDGQGRFNFNWPCHGKRVRFICIFGVGDLPSLTSRKEMFANKFHLDYEPLTLDCLEEWLWNMTMDEYSGRLTFNHSFYRSLDTARNHVTNDAYGR